MHRTTFKLANIEESSAQATLTTDGIQSLSAPKSEEIIILAGVSR